MLAEYGGMHWYVATLCRAVWITPHRPPNRFPRSDGTTVEGSPDMATDTGHSPGEGP